MSSFDITSDDLIILRDGRPFGNGGLFGGTSFDWPYPQTLAGMCRSAIGRNFDKDFFNKKNKDYEKNVECALNISINRILPQLTVEEDEYLLPTPADLVFSEVENKRKVHSLCFKSLNPDEGSDIQNDNWLYPFLNHDAKPAPKPKFMREKFAQNYLEGKVKTEQELEDLNESFVASSISDTRVHTAIDNKTKTVKEKCLFAESGFYLKAYKVSDDEFSSEKNPHAEVLGDLKIRFDLSGLSENMKMPKHAYLGGERRRVNVNDSSPASYPAPLSGLKSQKYLKLLLTTHGDFKSWAPKWLVPSGDESSCNWVIEPRSKVELRLRSAVLSGWSGVSGWDYDKRAPKPFKKLVCSGSVYIVELKNEDDAPKLIADLWGKSICEIDSQQERDGYGQVVIAKATHISE